MKVPPAQAHMQLMSVQVALGVTEAPALCFADIYRDKYNQVCRWLRTQGVRTGDLEDVAQDVFCVVERRLSGFDGQHLDAWLYRICANHASDYRRKAWFRRIFLGRTDREWGEDVSPAPTPVEQLEDRERRCELGRVLDRLSPKHREVLVLFELEGLSGPAIAGLLEIPVATVWTRLHHARKHFLDEVARRRGEAR